MLNTLLDFIGVFGIILGYLFAVVILVILSDMFLYTTNYKYRRWYNTNVYNIKTSFHFNRKAVDKMCEMSDEEFEKTYNQCEGRYF